MEIKVRNPNPVYDVSFSHQELQLLHILLGVVNSDDVRHAHKEMTLHGQTTVSDVEDLIVQDLVFKIYEPIHDLLKGNK